MLLAVGPVPSLPANTAMVGGAEAALAPLTNQPVSLALTTPDILPALINLIRTNHLTTPVAVIGPAQPATGAKAIRMGAVEYLTEPVDSRLLTALIAKHVSAPSSGPIGQDPRTLHLLEQAKQFAASQATVLLRGESGSGKEVFARYVHQQSPRAGKPFIAVNCAAIPENLLESELFGHSKGAFSGALAERKGKFQQASGGTLLLDEISEMDLSLQAKLLRAIQERVVDPIGADKPVPVDIRLIATTNRQLENYVAEGKFREDLYFRLSVVTLDLPPLRERPGDILPLARHFIAAHAAANGYKAAPSLTPEAEAKLTSCYWKGNVRELENTLHRALLLTGPSGATITPDHLILSPMSLMHMNTASNNENARASITPASSSIAAAARAYGNAGNEDAPTTFIPKRLAEVERDTLVATLAYTQGNRQYAADLLGISLTILAEKLSAAGLAA
ncbi:MAG: AAA domain-containing protein [Proteobacteria bacterium]|nr:AAA domain-containing protein [Pseudomonadota bacterium]